MQIELFVFDFICTETAFMLSLPVLFVIVFLVALLVWYRRFYDDLITFFLRHTYRNLLS